MSLDLLSLMGAPSPKLTSTEGGGEQATAEAGAAFASLLAAVASETTPLAGQGAMIGTGTGSGEAKSAGQTTSESANPDDLAASANTPATQVTVLPGLKPAVQALPMQETPQQLPAETAPPSGGSPTMAIAMAAATAPATATTIHGSLPWTPPSRPATPAGSLDGTLLAGGSTEALTEPPTATMPSDPAKTAPGTSTSLPQQPAPQTADVAGSTVTVAAAPEATSALHPRSADTSNGDDQPELKMAAETPPESGDKTATTEARAEATAKESPVATASNESMTATTPDEASATTSADQAPVAGEVDLVSTVTTARATSSTQQASQPTQHAPVDPSRIQAQVTRALVSQGALTGGDETVSLQLNPEHLGKVEVKLTAQGDRLEVVFTAQSPEAEQALREGARDLARTLGVRADGRWQHVDVKVSESTQSSTDQDEAGTDDQEEPRQQREQRRDQDQQDPGRRRRQGR